MPLARSLRILACALLAAASQPSSAEPPTYDTVGPILREHCTRCHRPGDVAPMSLRTYGESRPWARAIARAVSERTMPPWFADSEPGVFRNDARLSEAEIETLVAWARGGAAAGVQDVQDPVPAPQRDESPADAWKVGRPDLVVSMPEPYPVPAAGTIDYVFLRLGTGLETDRWIRAIEVLPGDRSVIHHIDVMLCEAECQQEIGLERGVPGFLPRSEITEPPDFSPEAALDGAGGDFLFSFLPGGQPLVLPEGYARLLPADAELLLSLHYTAKGEATEDLSHVGFVFADEPPEKRVLSLILDNQTIWIPAGAESYTAESRIILGTPVEVLALTPHMHFRGKRSEVVATSPEGERRSLLHLPRYDFNWQITYELAETLRLQAGTAISVLSTFDNSAANPYNPDPTQPVSWGRQSWDEMASAFVEIAVPRDTDLEALVRD